MSLLITNDDGIEAPGLEALRHVAVEFGEVIVVAPDRQHSGSGHRISEDGPIPIDAKENLNHTPLEGRQQIVQELVWHILLLKRSGFFLESMRAGILVVMCLCQGQLPQFVKRH